MKKILYVVIALPIIALIYFFGLGFYSQSLNQNHGIVNDQLKPCPDKPNCVSSQEDRDSHYVPPIEVESVRNSLQKLVDYFSKNPEYQLQQVSNNYLHVVHKSKIFKYRDDIEFYGDPEKRLLHVRSASRVGYSDIGTNKKRVEKLRSLITN
ncbi:MAG: DUF1499 domain-containing protein [Bdellovibrionales bacterium]|nr:DUF1499 domain-containing protein [Bdellovibrionales bacterium]